MEKQIEEMANFIAEGRFYEPNANQIRLFIGDAESLYNAGYRKQVWISVEERLPEKNYHDYVLAWNGLHVEFLHYSHRYKQWEDYYSLKEHPWKVTHWMPLPEPPKGE